MKSLNAMKAEIDEMLAADARMNALQNEGGDGYMHENPRLAALQHEYYVELKAAKVAEWDLETTKARRAAWNAAVRSGKYESAREVRKIEADTGINMSDLLAAIKRHGLV